MKVSRQMLLDIAAELEGIARESNEWEYRAGLIITGSLIRGFLQLPRNRQIELNLLGTGNHPTIAKMLAGVMERDETAERLAEQSQANYRLN